MAGRDKQSLCDLGACDRFGNVLLDIFSNGFDVLAVVTVRGLCLQRGGLERNLLKDCGI